MISCTNDMNIPPNQSINEQQKMCCVFCILSLLCKNLLLPCKTCISRPVHALHKMRCVVCTLLVLCVNMLLLCKTCISRPVHALHKMRCVVCTLSLLCKTLLLCETFICATGSCSTQNVLCRMHSITAAWEHSVTAC